MRNISGTEETRQFYDTEGWSERDGHTVDQALFGVREEGPIRMELYRSQLFRIRQALLRSGRDLKLLECGCGGNPERALLDICGNYTGIDFSSKGIDVARRKLQTSNTEFRLLAADVCDLPFYDSEFDAVYSAHMIYHIDDPAAQEAAIFQMMRVTRPGGVIVLVAANPFPFLFPFRFLRRLIASIPALRKLANRPRAIPPLPYLPMSINWMRKRLGAFGNVDVVTGGIASTHFNHTVSEHRGTGKARWKVVRYLELNCPRLSSYLGNYVLYVTTKKSATSP